MKNAMTCIVASLDVGNYTLNNEANPKTIGAMNNALKTNAARIGL